METHGCLLCGGRGWEQGGPLFVPFTLCSLPPQRPQPLWAVLFPLQSIMQCCDFFPISCSSRQPWNWTSCPILNAIHRYIYRLLYMSYSWRMITWHKITLVGGRGGQRNFGENTTLPHTHNTKVMNILQYHLKDGWLPYKKKKLKKK